MADIPGTSGDDFIHVAGDGFTPPSGYADTALATDTSDAIGSGGGGVDIIHAGGGADTITFVDDLGPDDIIDGGAGSDHLQFTGANVVAFTANALSGIEFIDLNTGSLPSQFLWLHSFAFVDANIAANAAFTFDAHLAGENEDVRVNWSKETDARVLQFRGGAGNDTVVGNKVGISEQVFFSSGGDDSYTGSGRVSFADKLTTNDHVDGVGRASIELSGDYNMVLSSSLFADVASVSLGGPHTYVFTLDNSLVSSGETMVFDGVYNQGQITIDGSAITAGDLTLVAGSGDDTLIGGGGDDTISVGSAASNWGADTVQGGAGDDIVSADTAGPGDVFDGGAGFDSLSLLGGSSILGISNYSFVLGTNVLGFESIALTAGVADYTITVTEAAVAAGKTVRIDGSALLGAGFSNVTFDGLGETNGKFIVFGSFGSDELIGGGSDDALNGGVGADRLTGADGADTLNGGAGGDTLYGGAGADIYLIDDKFDVAVEDAAAGIDLVKSSISRTLEANLENLTLTGANAINGTGNGAANTLTGNSANNRLMGGASNDVLIGAGGADDLRGDNGSDTASYDASNARVRANLATGVGLEGHAQGDTYDSIERLIGSDFNDVLTGNSVGNVLIGGTGVDIIDGRGGQDSLFGGGGDDVFLFSSGLGAADTIDDFSVGNDEIRLDNNIFTGLAAGALSAAAFRIGAAAADASDRIIYNSANGFLSFDKDGNGAQTAIHFATLDAGLALTNADFVVI